jgi:hypothetical protein
VEERVHPAACDCERIRPGLVAQPANAISSLAYVVAGFALWRRARRRDETAPTSTVFAALVAANGVGSVGFHGPGGRFGHWLHDTALLGTMATMVVENVVSLDARGQRVAVPAATVATGVAAATLLAAPASTNALSVAVGAAATSTQALAAARTDLTPATRQRLARSALFLSVGSVVNRLTRTGGRWCRPDARLQGHALWHILTAASLYEWGAAASD